MAKPPAVNYLHLPIECHASNSWIEIDIFHVSWTFHMGAACTFGQCRWVRRGSWSIVIIGIGIEVCCPCVPNLWCGDPVTEWFEVIGDWAQIFFDTADCSKWGTSPWIYERSPDDSAPIPIWFSKSRIAHIIPWFLTSHSAFVPSGCTIVFRPACIGCFTIGLEWNRAESSFWKCWSWGMKHTCPMKTGDILDVDPVNVVV